MSTAPATEKLAASLVVGLAGPWPTARERAWLGRWHPAGVILFARNVTGFHQLRGLCDLLHELVPGCEIMADHEGGPVCQLAPALGLPPSAFTLGTLKDADLTRAVHRETARRMQMAGVDRVLAPCADVLLEPRNPVIGARAFGEDAAEVTAQVTAAVQGLLQEGVRCCLKHWPGHGASGRDTHQSAAATGGDSAESPPFLAGLAAGAGAIMVGHLIAPGAVLPATLDADRLASWRLILEAVAQGPVLFFADDVTMGGLRPAMDRLGVDLDDGLDEGMVEPGAVPLEWLQKLATAGLDRLLIRGIPWRALPLQQDVDSESGEDSEVTRNELRKEWEPGPYEEALGRARAEIAPGFLDRELALGWLDLTPGDRWEVATGGFPERRAEFARHLERTFEGVVDLAASTAVNEGPLKRLLVTAHRPLPESLLEADRWSGSMADQGVCLALGHPGLVRDLRQILGAGWTITPYHEIDWGIWLA